MKKNFIGFSILVLVCSIIFFIAYKKDKALDESFNTTDGIIYDLETSSKSPNVFATYNFKIGNQDFADKSSIPCPSMECLQFLYKTLKGKSLKVVYEKSNPKNSKMLFQAEDYNKYGISPNEYQLLLIGKIDSLINTTR